MKSNQYDLAVFGSSPQALFLAALLAEDQSRQIVLVHDPANAVRLSRGMDLSVAPLTRPETWRQLAAGVEETRRRLAGWGLAHCLEHTPVLMMRDEAPGRSALGHVRAMAAAHGIAVERLANAPDSDTATHSLLIREAWRLVADRARQGFSAAHSRLGVEPVAVGDIDELLFTRDGNVKMTVGGERIGIELAILADDEAIAAHANQSDYTPLLASQARTAFLTEPVAERLPGRAPVVLGEGFTAHQRPSGALCATGDGAAGPVAERLLRHLPQFEHARLAGRGRFEALVASDGAPLVGRGRTRRCWIVAGLGETGAFMMPGLARFIAGGASAEEKSYWRGRSPDRSGPRVDELSAAAPAEAA